MIPSAIHAATNKALVLSILSHMDESYGYEIIQTVERLSDGAFRWKEGMLYPALHRMEKEGLIQSRWGSANGRKRKYYQITDSGREALTELKRHWNTANETMQRSWKLKWASI